MEMEHNKSPDELKTKLSEKIKSLRNQYNPKISSYGIQHFWNKENDVLIVKCEKYDINWCLVLFPSLIQVYEEAPAHIKPFLSSYRNQFKSIIHNELQEVVN